MCLLLVIDQLGLTGGLNKLKSLANPNLIPGMVSGPVAVWQVARRRAASIRCLHSWSSLLLKRRFFAWCKAQARVSIPFRNQPHAKFPFLSRFNPFLVCYWAGFVALGCAYPLRDCYLSMLECVSHLVACPSLACGSWPLFFRAASSIGYWCRKADSTTHTHLAMQEHTLVLHRYARKG